MDASSALSSEKYALEGGLRVDKLVFEIAQSRLYTSIYQLFTRSSQIASNIFYLFSACQLIAETKEETAKLAEAVSALSPGNSTLGCTSKGIPIRPYKVHGGRGVFGGLGFRYYKTHRKHYALSR